MYSWLEKVSRRKNCIFTTLFFIFIPSEQSGLNVYSVNPAVSEKASNDQQLQGVHLLLNKENVLDEEKKENRNDDDKVVQEKDVYDKLLEAMENGNEEMMDQMLEEFDRLEKTKADKKVLGTKVKGKGRGR